VTAQRSNGRRPARPVKAVPDPKPKAVGFWPVELVITLGGGSASLALCGSCSALIPATDKAQAQHRNHHGLIEGGSPR
jgi:hypothetical protein